MYKLVIALFAGSVVSGCAGRGIDDALDEGHACTAVTIFGIWVHAKDGSTGAALSGVRGWVQSGTYVDTLRDDGAGDGVYIGARETPGTFSMHLEHAGYMPLDVNDIVVTSNICHVVPTVLYDTLEAPPQLQRRKSPGR